MDERGSVLVLPSLQLTQYPTGVQPPVQSPPSETLTDAGSSARTAADLDQEEEVERRDGSLLANEESHVDWVDHKENTLLSRENASEMVNQKFSEAGSFAINGVVGDPAIPEEGSLIIVPIENNRYVATWEEPVYSDLEFAFACFTFLLIGVADFYGYSIILNTGGAINRYIYPDASGLENRLFAWLVSCDFVITVILSVVGSLNKALIYVGMITMAVGAAALLVCVQVVKGDAGVWLAQICAVVMGGGSSLSGNAAFCFSNQLHNPIFPGVVSTGSGGAGILSFLFWIVFKDAVFGNTTPGVTKALTVVLSVGTVLPILVFFLVYIFLRRPWVQQYLSMPKRDMTVSFITPSISAVKKVSEDYSIIGAMKDIDGQPLASAVTTLPRKSSAHGVGVSRQIRGIDHKWSRQHSQPQKMSIKKNFYNCIAVLKKSYPAALGVFCVLLLAYGVVPVVGPLHWKHLTQTESDLLIGIFQMGDVTGRYIPTIASWLRPEMTIVKKLLLALLGLDSIIVLTAHLPDIPVLTHIAFRIPLILCLAMIMGFASTLSVIKAPSYLPPTDPLGRSKASSLAILGLLAGAAIGQWMANLLIIGV